MKALIAAAIAFAIIGTAQAAPPADLSANYYPQLEKIEWIADGPRANRDLAVRMTCEDDGAVTQVRMNRVYWNNAKNANWIAGTGSFEWDTCEGVLFDMPDATDSSTWFDITAPVVVTK